MHADHCIEVADGSYIYIDPGVRVSWPEHGAVYLPHGRLRILHRDQRGIMSVADAEALVAAGVARPVGDRLFERPTLCAEVFDWDPTGEVAFVREQVAALGPAARGIEFGCGNGRLLLPLREAGCLLDGVDAAEGSVRWLRARLDERSPGPEGGASLYIGDISAWAAPQQYDYAIAALNTLRYLPSVASLRRHMHLAAVSVRPGGRYLVHIGTWTEGAGPDQPGSAGEWPTAGRGQHGPLRIVWSKVREDLVDGLDLERVEVHAGGEEIHREHQIQLAFAEERWGALFEERGEWRVAGTWADAHPAPVLLDPPHRGNLWCALERTAATAAPLFTR